MKPLSFLAWSTFLLLASSRSAQSKVGTTEPVGSVRVVTALPNSDTLVGLPLTLTHDFEGALSGKTSAGDGTVALNFAGPTWSANQFAALYYVRFTSGSLQGRFYTVQANTGNTLTIETNGDNLSPAAAEDTIRLFKYWTLQGLFPKEEQKTFVVSTGNSKPQRKSELLIPDLASPGNNLPPRSAFFITKTGWKNSKDFSDASNQVLYPDSYFIIRHPAGVGPTSFTMTGAVPVTAQALFLGTRRSGPQDNFASLAHPVDVSLQDSGLAAGFVASTDNRPQNRRDELYLFDNQVAAKNKSPRRKFFRVGSNWIEDAAGFPQANATILKAGEAVMIRKYSTADGVTSVVGTQPGD
jgi:uncharacterized protein (TIGR02597 family)